MLTPVGKFIDERMAAVGIRTMAELAKRSGVSKSSLSRMRNAEHSLNSKTVRKLAAALKCDEGDIEVIAPEAKQMPRRRTNMAPQFQKTRTLCWECRNAVPDDDHGCSWSRRLDPVEGWDAVETSAIRIDGGYERRITSALVLGCPEFVPDKKDNDNNGE